MTQDKDIIVKCAGLTKTYGGELQALKNLDLEVARGEVFGYIGHNGAGKTTTIRILAGMLKATSGSATVAGADVNTNRGKIRTLIGYMPDKFGVYDQMRVWEYLDFFGAAFKIPRKQRKKRIEEVLDLTDGEYLRDRFVDTLSKGMKQTVGIARTLIHDPQVLLLDEPASGLDPQARIRMRQLIRHLADEGKTLIVSSHILPELAAICDSVGIIHQGDMKIAGPIDEVLATLSHDSLMEMKVLEGLDTAVEIAQANELCSKIDQDDAEGLLRFRFSGDDDDLAAMLAATYERGSKVVTFREVPISLEDAYMSISGIGRENDDDIDAENAEATGEADEAEVTEAAEALEAASEVAADDDGDKD